MYHKTRLVFSYKKAISIILELAYIFNFKSFFISIEISFMFISRILRLKYALTKNKH